MPAYQTVSSRDAATEPPGTDSRRVWIAGTAPPADTHGTSSPTRFSKFQPAVADIDAPVYPVFYTEEVPP